MRYPCLQSYLGKCVVKRGGALYQGGGAFTKGEYIYYIVVRRAMLYLWHFVVAGFITHT